MTDYNFQFQDPIISKMRSVFVDITESLQIVGNKALLTEIPDSFEKVTITGQSITWVETKNPSPEINQYYVDYSNGIVTFHKSRNNLTLSFTYKGRGQQFFPASRIYDKVSPAGEVTKTLQDILDAGETAITVLDELDEFIDELQGAVNNANDAAEHATEVADGLADAENERVLAENTRNSNESTRQSNEIERQENEEDRNDAEVIRESNESTRKSNEIARQDNESIRQSNELVRQSYEVTRQETLEEMEKVIENTRYVEVWDNTTNYKKNNIIRYNGSSYMSLVDDNLNNTPNEVNDTEFWGLLSRRGVDGEGSVSSVNSIVPDVNGNITLTANNVGAISSSEKAQPNGIATLDENGKITESQLSKIEYNDLSENLQEKVDNIDSNKLIVESPIGFPNRIDSTISFDNTTRTFSISPTNTSYDVYFMDKKYTKTGTETIIIPNVTGVYYIYFDPFGILSYSTTFPQLDNMIYIAYKIWNADQTNPALQFALGDERHSTAMNKKTHAWLHSHAHTQWLQGLNLYNYTLNDDSNDGIKFSLTNGVIDDEDLRHSITHSTTPSSPFQQKLQDWLNAPIMYREGVSGAWKETLATDYGVINTTSGRVNYNQNTGSEWKQTQVGNGTYVAYWLVATNLINQPIKWVQGQRTDTTLENAKANNNHANLNWGSNMIPEEFKVLWRVIYQTSDSYTSDKKAILRDVQDVRSVQTTILSGGATNVVRHPDLPDLNYENSGHTGFAKSATNMDVDQFKADYLSGADSPLAYNLLPDSGRFVPAGTPLTVQITAPFAPNSILATPYNGTSTAVSAGKFINDNTTFGGSAGTLAQPVIDLLNKMDSLGIRSGIERRYGTEFYMAQMTMGSGTSAALTIEGNTKYLATTNAIVSSRRSTMGYWIAVSEDAYIVNVISKNMEFINSAKSPATIKISPSECPVFITRRLNYARGYFSDGLGIYANEGTVIQIALPAVVPGGIGLGWITSPMPSIVSPIYTADGVYATTLQNGWTGNAYFSKNYLGDIRVWGAITPGTKTSGTLIANIPSGYRPSVNGVSIQVFRSTGTVITGIVIFSNGNMVIFNPASSDTNLNGEIVFEIIYRGAA